MGLWHVQALARSSQPLVDMAQLRTIEAGRTDLHQKWCSIVSDDYRGDILSPSLLAAVKFKGASSISWLRIVRWETPQLAWAGHTNFWTLGTGTSIWLVGQTTSSHPRSGTNLRIALADGAVVLCRVVRASRSEIVIELDGYHRSMTPAPRHSRTWQRFPGSEWVLGKPCSDFG